MTEKPIVSFKDVSIVFGSAPKSALSMIDDGRNRADIQEATGQILGVAECSLDVMPGEIVVLMGLSGSGKSTLLRAVNGLNPVVRGSVEVAMTDDLSTDADPAKANRSTLRKL
ncbi:MAG: ATP-binding cassette domain-containing protein, partial [Pseudomonadota bacterium]